MHAYVLMDNHAHHYAAIWGKTSLHAEAAADGELN
jgi:hypothetical protein